MGSSEMSCQCLVRSELSEHGVWRVGCNETRERARARVGTGVMWVCSLA